MTLIEFIRQNPEATDAEIIAIANTPVYSIVPVTTIRRIVPPISVVPQLQLLILDVTANAAARGLAVGVVNILAGSFTVVDRTDPTDNAAYEATVPAILAMGLITQQQADALLALGVSRHDYTQQDVTDARTEIAEQVVRDTLHNQLAGRHAAAELAINDGTAATWQDVLDVIAG